MISGGASRHPRVKKPISAQGGRCSRAARGSAAPRWRAGSRRARAGWAAEPGGPARCCPRAGRSTLRAAEPGWRGSQRSGPPWGEAERVGAQAAHGAGAGVPVRAQLTLAARAAHHTRLQVRLGPLRAGHHDHRGGLRSCQEALPHTRAGASSCGATAVPHPAVGWSPPAAVCRGRRTRRPARVGAYPLLVTLVAPTKDRSRRGHQNRH